MSIKEDRFNELKKEYGAVASWAIWDMPSSNNLSTKENVGSMNWAKDENLLIEEIKTDFVFIALNAADNHKGKDGHAKQDSWINFHSSYSKGRDYKLRFAVMKRNEKGFCTAKGSYITDLIKDIPTKDAKELKSILKNNPQKLESNIEKLKEELSILDNKKKPILIALGRDCERFLRNTLEKEGYRVYYLPHFSAASPKLEDYRGMLQTILDER
ncbi:hypothetical protein [uncultured Fibrobacter sp.]|uniref:hypothetical protein n=1 Tax=uncultured Fibrobacter sp. TaxID=261512 RepID=UPI0025EF7480|nr:hypothetical protein [uncultured Fibrobacter sp.]